MLFQWTKHCHGATWPFSYLHFPSRCRVGWCWGHAGAWWQIASDHVSLDRQVTHHTLGHHFMAMHHVYGWIVPRRWIRDLEGACFDDFLHMFSYCKTEELKDVCLDHLGTCASLGEAFHLKSQSKHSCGPRNDDVTDDFSPEVILSTIINCT